MRQKRRIARCVICVQDLKPKNVFLTAKNHVRLGDLGCAKLLKHDGGLARTQIGKIRAAVMHQHRDNCRVCRHAVLYESRDLGATRLRRQERHVGSWLPVIRADHVSPAISGFRLVIARFRSVDSNFRDHADVAGLAHKVKTATAPRISKHYSAELADLVAALLSEMLIDEVQHSGDTAPRCLCLGKDPRVRPDARAVLAMPCIVSRMHLVPPAGPESSLVST
jgi:serine/threonine protein kinase